MVLRNCPRKGINGSVPRRDEARAACGIGPQDKVVLYQGYILLHRGLGTVIGAAALVPECLFLLIGPDSPYCVGLRHLVQEQRIGNVLFMGHKDERERNLYMAAADLGVAMIQDGSLSYRYSFANKNSEYLMNGLPVLASDLPEHRRVLCRTGAAILADPESASDVARAIREFFRLPPDLRRGMRQRARQAALDELNMETQMGPLLEFYKNVGKRS